MNKIELKNYIDLRVYMSNKEFWKIQVDKSIVGIANISVEDRLETIDKWKKIIFLAYKRYEIFL